MRIYISAAVAEIDRARSAADAVRSLGCDVTSDWIEAIKPDSPHDRDMTDADRQRVAIQDLDGIERCGLLWLLVPAERRGRGAWVELGFALARGRTVICSGPDARETIFTSLCSRTFAADLDALAWLASREDRRRM